MMNPEELARLERLEHLIARSGGSGGGGVLTEGDSTVVWKPGVPSSGNVFDTWPEVVAAVALLPGIITIAVDPSVAPAVIPAGNWDLRPGGISGTVEMINGDLGMFTSFVTIANAAVTIRGLTGILDIAIDNQSTVDVITYDATYLINFYLLGSAAIFQNVLAAGAAFIKVTAGGPGIFLEDFTIISTLDTGTNAIQISGGFTIIFMQDHSLIDANQILRTGGLVAAEYSGNGLIASQAGVAVWAALEGAIQSGTAQLTNGVSPVISAVIQTTGAQILCTVNTPVADALTANGYAALAVDRVPGGPGVGSFVIKALSAVGGGDVNVADQSSVDWILKNNPPD